MTWDSLLKSCSYISPFIIPEEIATAIIYIRRDRDQLIRECQEEYPPFRGKITRPDGQGPDNYYSPVFA